MLKSLSFLLPLLTATTVLANDSSFGDENGTIELQKQPEISMEKESLFLSEAKVKVDYEFLNHGSKDQTVSVAFPMPPMYFGDSDHNEISDFKLMVNGKNQSTERQLVVLLGDNKEDISQAFADTGWTEADVADFTDSGEIPAGKKALPQEWLDAEGYPAFTLNEYFTWQQTFPAGKTISISHTYTPSVTTGVPQPAKYILEEYKEETCIDASAEKGITKRESEMGVGWANLRYILTTGKNWNGPIKDFHLTIQKQNADDLLSLCFDPNLKKTGDRTFEFHQQNFIPQRDLNLLFIRKAQ